MTTLQMICKEGLGEEKATQFHLGIINAIRLHLLLWGSEKINSLCGRLRDSVGLLLTYLVSKSSLWIY